MFTFPGDEKQSEISQHSDSLNFFFKILINHEAFWQPPQILRNPCLISHSLSAYSVWSLTARLERTAGTGGPQGPPMAGGAAAGSQGLCRYPLSFCEGSPHDECPYMGVE